jgi:MFS family permease
MTERRRVTIPDYWELLRSNRNYRLLWGSQIISEIGDWFFTLALYNLLLDFTGKAESIGFAFVLQVLPQCLTAPAAGVLNDRLSRRKVMIVADLCRAAIIGCMLFVRSPEMLPLLYVLLFLETVMWGLFEPARAAVVPNITKGDEIFVGNALSSTTWSFNFAMGFTVGGVALALLGREAVFALDACSFLVSAMLVRRMSFHEPHMEGHAPLHWRDLLDFKPIAEGIRYVKQDGRMFATLFVKSGNSIIASNWVLLTMLGRDRFAVNWLGVEPERAAALGVSLLMGCRGIGALTGPILQGYVAGRNQTRQRYAILIGFVLASFGYFLLSQAPNLAMACVAVIIAHLGSTITWVGSTILLQLNTEDKFRGRVFSAEFGIAVIVMSLASSSAGVFIDHGWTPQQVAGLTASLLLIPVLFWATVLSKWEQLRSPQTPPPTPAEPTASPDVP